MIAVLASACSAAPSDPDMAAGSDVYVTCALCHGGQGEGGTGPSFDNLMTTFDSCDDQIEWIRLGSDRWSEEFGSSYGSALDRPIKGGMPAFEETVTELEIRQVSFYERVRFGGVLPDTERVECGL